MNVLGLRYFVATMEAGSFAGAAARLGLTQPAVSRQVRLLERELGLSLVVPVAPRRLVPTASGEILLAGARELETALEQLKRDAVARAVEPTGPLCVAVPPAIGATLLQAVMPEYLSRCPSVRVSILTGYSGYVESWLHDGQADIGFLWGEPQGGDIETEALFEMDMFLIAPTAGLGRGPAVQNWSRCRLSDLTALPLIQPRRTHGLRTLVDQALSKAGLIPASPVIEVDDSVLLKRLVRAGLGCAVLGYDGIREEAAAGSLCAIPLTDPGISWTLSSASRRGRHLSLAAKMMCQMVERAARRLVISGEIRGRSSGTGPQQDGTGQSRRHAAR